MVTIDYSLDSFGSPETNFDFSSFDFLFSIFYFSFLQLLEFKLGPFGPSSFLTSIFTEFIPPKPDLAWLDPAHTT